MPASDYDEDPRSKVCVESGLATIMKPSVGRRIYDNFRLKVMLCLIKAKCFDILWTEAKDWKPDGAGAVKRKLRSKNSVGGAVQGMDKEGITIEEATIIAKTIILEHLVDGPWQKKLLQICEKKRPIFSFFWDLDMRYFDNKCSKANVSALRTFQDFKFKPDEDDLTLAGQVHDHYRDEYEFLAKLNFTELEKWEMYQAFLDLDVMPNVHLKDAVQSLCEKLEGRYKGQCSEDLLQDFRDKLEDVVEDFRLKGTFATLEGAANQPAYPLLPHPHGVVMSAQRAYEDSRSGATYSRRTRTDYSAIPGQGRIPRRDHDQGNRGRSAPPAEHRVSWRDRRQDSSSATPSAPASERKSLPRSKPDSVKEEDWLKMDSDAMDVCVGPNNKDPRCRKIIENPDGTRRRCGQKHFTRQHRELHPTARLAVIENQDALDYQFYLEMKSQDGFPSYPAPSATRGWSEFCDNLVTVATVVGVLGCGAYLLLPECVLLANCAPVAATANSVVGWTVSSAMVPFVAAGPPPAVAVVATLCRAHMSLQHDLVLLAVGAALALAGLLTLLASSPGPILLRGRIPGPGHEMRLPRSRPDSVSEEDWLSMGTDAMDICVGTHNKDPRCRRIIHYPDGTRGRCGLQHFTRQHCAPDHVSLFDEVVQLLQPVFPRLLWPALVAVLASLAVSVACSAALPAAYGSDASFSWPEPPTSAMVPYDRSLGVPISVDWSPSIGAHLLWLALAQLGVAALMILALPAAWQCFASLRCAVRLRAYEATALAPPSLVVLTCCLGPRLAPPVYHAVGWLVGACISSCGLGKALPLLTPSEASAYRRHAVDSIGFWEDFVLSTFKPSELRLFRLLHSVGALEPLRARSGRIVAPHWLHLGRRAHDRNRVALSARCRSASSPLRVKRGSDLCLVLASAAVLVAVGASSAGASLPVAHASAAAVGATGSVSLLPSLGSVGRPAQALGALIATELVWRLFRLVVGWSWRCSVSWLAVRCSVFLLRAVACAACYPFHILTTADSLIRGLPPRRAATMLVCSVYMDFAGAVESTLSCLLPAWSVALAAYRVLASLPRAAWSRPGGWEAYWASDGNGEAYWASEFGNSGEAYWTRMLSVYSTTVRASVRRRGPSLLLLALMACCARRRHILVTLNAAPASAAVGLGASSLITIAATCTQVLGSVVLLGGIILALCPRKYAIKFCMATAVLIPACAALSPDSLPRPAPVPACSTLSPIGASHALLPNVSVPTHSSNALPCIPCVPFTPPGPSRPGDIVARSADSSVRHAIRFFHPDSQANVSTCTSEDDLLVVTSRQALSLRGVGDSAGRVTAVGVMRCSLVDPSSGRVSTFDLPNVHVCPSSGCFLLGNDARHVGVVFNGETGHVRVRNDSGVTSFPAELDNDLWRLPVVIHKPHGRLAFGSSPVAKTFNKALEAGSDDPAPAPADPERDSRLTMAEYFGGCGFSSHGMREWFRTCAYFDSSDEAATTFANSFPQVPAHGSFESCLEHAAEPSSFVSKAKLADIAMCGVPCSHVSRLNFHRDESGPVARLLVQCLELLRLCKHKVFVVETLPESLRADCGRLYRDFCDKAATFGYVVFPMQMSPLDHGGVQYRRRLYLGCVRLDVANRQGPLSGPPALGSDTRPQMLSFLAPVRDLDVPALRVDRDWRVATPPSASGGYRGPIPAFVHGSYGPHRTAYSVYGPCPTLTSSDCVIHDPRPGVRCCRRLTLDEVLCMQGCNPCDIRFDDTMTESECRSMVGLGMDGFCLRALGRYLHDYLRSSPNVPTAMLTASEWHVKLGHASQEQTSKMFLPGSSTPVPFITSPCPVCPAGKSKTHARNRAQVPKAANYLDLCYCDIKVCSHESRSGVTCLIGFCDSKTGKNWVIPLKSRHTSSVIAAMETWRVQMLNNTPVGHLRLDNDSCFTSAAFRAYATASGLPISFSEAYHQHQNAMAEAIWSRCLPLTIINILCAPWLGILYWDRAFMHAAHMVNHRPASGKSVCPETLASGKPVDIRLLHEWGRVGYVHRDVHHGFSVRADKAYYLGPSQGHAPSVCDMLMCATGKIKQSASITWMGPNNDSVVSMPNDMDIELLPTSLPHAPDTLAPLSLASPDDFGPAMAEPHAHPDNVPADHGTGAYPRPRRVFAADPPSPSAAEPSAPAAVTRPEASEFDAPERVTLGDCSRIRSPAVLRRVRLVSNLAVDDAIGTMYEDNNGHIVPYKHADLNYDLRSGALILVRPSSPSPTAFDPSPAVAMQTAVVDDYVSGWGGTENLQYFSDKDAREIEFIAREDPHCTQPSWAFKIEVDGVNETYVMRPNRRPHAMRADGLPIPKDGIRIAHHSQMHKIDKLARRNDVLRSIEDEYGGLDRRDIWELVPLPPGETAFPVMLVIRVKYLPSGEEDKVKSRAVIMGNLMEKGKHYGDTFSPCGSLTTVRCMLVDALQHGMCCKNIDIKLAFTFGKPDRPTYVRQPPGRKLQYGEDGQPLVYFLKQLLYGTPSGPRRFHVEMHNALIKHGLTPSSTDPCLYTSSCGLDRLNCCVYVDDCFLTYTNSPGGRKLHSQLIHMLQSRFELQDDGLTDCVNFLGMHLEWASDRSSVRVSTPAIIDTLLESEGMSGCRPALTPGIPHTLVSLLHCPADGPEGDADRALMRGKDYRSRIGALLWVSRNGRPDIAFQVNALARVSHNPGIEHWNQTTYLLRYLKGTRDFALEFRRDPKLPRSHFVPVGYSDADWAPNYGNTDDNYRSTTGWLFQIANNTVSWRSRRQSRSAQSSAESEYYAAADAAKEAIHLRRLLGDLGHSCIHPVDIHVDNQSAIKQSNAPVDQEMSRHVDLRSHFLREMARLGHIRCTYIPTADQRADVMTKNMPAPGFRRMRDWLGVFSGAPSVR